MIDKFYIIYGEVVKCVSMNEIMAVFEYINSPEGYSMMVEDLNKIDLIEVTKETNPEYWL